MIGCAHLEFEFKARMNWKQCWEQEGQ